MTKGQDGQGRLEEVGPKGMDFGQAEESRWEGSPCWKQSKE